MECSGTEMRKLRQLIALQSRWIEKIYKKLPINFTLKQKIKNKLLKFNGIRRLYDYFKSISHYHLPSDKLIYQQYVKNILQINAKIGNGSEYTFNKADYLDAKHLKIKAIAFYLPQFHPIPENDLWWGKGFTEWTNVTKAVPQFLGHYQPHLPGELGFYDLRLPQIMRQQVTLAKQYGIFGFCFHYYWFNGKQLLEQPLNQFLADKTLAFNFCLCWANENWTRRWDGAEQEVLMAQQYTAEDDVNFIDALAKIFSDKRYIRIDDKPVLIIYRAMLIPELKETVQRWRARIKTLGFADLYLVAVLFYDIPDDHTALGFDAVVEFPPHRFHHHDAAQECSIINPNFTGYLYSYQKMVEHYTPQYQSGTVKFRGVMPSWDNEARRPGAGVNFIGANPMLYSQWLRKACKATALHHQQERLLFINAWNEWAEGAHLEPDRRFGYGYLQATATILSQYYHDPETLEFIEQSNQRFKKLSSVALILHCYYEDLILPIFENHLIPQNNKADLILTVVPTIRLNRLQQITQLFTNVYFIVHENRGRDIAPFLIALKFVDHLGYEFICKLHTKKSPHRSDGSTLRESLLNGLLGHSATLEKIVKIFEKDPQLGLLVPQQQILNLQQSDYYLGNIFWLDKLLTRLGRADLIDHYSFNFPAGSMYWCRTQALTGLDKLLSPDDQFEEEAGQTDGTLAHALERIVAFFAAEQGYSMKPISCL